MLLSPAPQKVKNDFSDELKKITDSDRFESLRRYYNHLNLADEKNREIVMPFTYFGMSDRFDTSRYFYFPTEFPVTGMNCFEKASSLYFAFQELYHRANPALVFLTDKDKNVHASVLFTHEEELWGADPNYGYFDKINLMNDSIVIKQKEGDLRVIKFEDIHQIEDSSLENMAARLRRDSGIVDFLYSSGQRPSYFSQLTLRQSLFMKVQPNNEVVSEIRLCETRMSGEPIDGSRNGCIRYTLNPSTGKKEVELLKYTDGFWGAINGVETLEIPSNPINDFSKLNHIGQLQDVFHYLKNVKKHEASQEQINAFLNNRNVRERFDNVFDLAKRIDGDTHTEFAKYLISRYGSLENVQPLGIPSIEEFKARGASLSIDDLFDHMNMVTDRLGRHGSEMCNLQLVPPFLKFVSDVEKYEKEVARHLVA